jgi:hypothetical protein
MTTNDRYASYMLRFQWVKNENQPTWIISVQSAKTGELRWFPGLDALVDFLHEEFDLESETSETTVESPQEILLSNNRLTKSK